MKYKKDDKILITNNSNSHSYKILDECYIIEVCNGFYKTSRNKWGERTNAGDIIKNDCELVGEITIHWMVIGVSDKCQEEADRNYEKKEQYFIWKSRDWRYVAEKDSWTIMLWKFISIKQKEEMPEYTLKQLKEKYWDFKLIK